MAKTKTQNATMATAGTFPSELAYGEFHINTEHPAFAEGVNLAAGGLGMSAKGMFYLLQYGLAQSMQDAIAGFAKKLDEAKIGGEGPDAEEPKYSAVEKKVMMHDRLKERLDAIMSGDVGHRAQGPRVKGVEKIMREYAQEVLVNAARAKGVTLPKKSDAMNLLIDQYLAKHGDAARVEAERRMAITGTPSDLDDILANL